MLRALELARQAAAAGEVPIGAVVAHKGDAIAEAGNSPISLCDPSAHAEILALRAAAKVRTNYRLTETTLYTTLEPCAMCAGAIVWARVARVVIALRDPKAGAAGSVLTVIPNEKLNHRPVVEFGLMENDSRDLLKNFFAVRR